jgi:hypothetical protein
VTWKNHGKCHIDHIKPCASFNLLDDEEQQKFSAIMGTRKP